MRQTIGLGVVLAVAVAAIRVAVPSGSALPQAALNGKSGGLRTRLVHPAAPATSYRGGCTAYDIEGPATEYPRDNDRGAAKSVIDTFFALDPEAETGSKLHSFPNIHYAVALTPDPRHTNLSLMFDRQAALIQQAAQDEGFTYNSSWFPWQVENGAFPLLEDKQFADDLTDHREACPGILLFRRSVQSAQPAPALPADPYAEALVVLVVGEQPTGGLNEDQWANAMLWLKKNASPMEQNQRSGDDRTSRSRILRILGPTFSGSLVSLNRDLKDIYLPAGDRAVDKATPAEAHAAAETFPDSNTPTRLLSGVVSGCSSIRWFQQRLIDDKMSGKIVFGSFSENDELGIYRFLSYLHEQGTETSDTAILSEDETAYALPNGAQADDKAPHSCDAPYDPGSRPVRLFYPRDISAIRNAYEKESVFSSPSQAQHAIHPILQDGDSDTGEPSNSSDTIPVYSGQLTAIAQEAILYGIVSNLRAHHTRYLLLRCTNPLDYLFLTRFFHRAYPEGRIVTLGADLLFRREIDTTEFRGVLALSTYPLLPRNQHWSWLSQNDKPPFSHAHRVFESNIEGSYIAARYLFGTQNFTDPPQASQPAEAIALPLKEDIPDYADPYWMNGSSRPAATKRQTGPPTWLSVVGRDGYWPIAVLNQEFQPKPGTGGSAFDMSKAPVSTAVQLTNTAAHYDRDQRNAKKLNSQILFGLPMAWSVCAAVALLLLAYQTFGIWKGSSMTSAGLFALFRRVSTPSQALLLGVNSGFAAGLLLQILAIVIGVPSTFEFIGDLDVVFLYGFAGAILLWLVYRGIAEPFRKDISRASFLLTLGFFLGAFYIAWWRHQESANNLPLFYRLAHLTSGVSPLVPALFVILGLYAWTWQAMAGNSLLCCGRPLLPNLGGVAAITGLRKRYLGWLGISTEATGTGPGYLDESEYRISSEMGKRIVAVASPLSVEIRVILLPTIVLIGALCFIAVSGPPLLSLESHAYALCLNLVLLLAFLLITAEAARLYFSWMELRGLLSALNRLRLRRTLSKLAAVTAGSLWSVSGSVQRIQYLFFSQQLDAAHRLNRISGNAYQSVNNAVEAGRGFASKTARQLDAGPRWDGKVTRHDPAGNGEVQVLVREEFNNAVADVLKNLLLPAWKKEDKSLNLPRRGPATDESGAGTFEMELSDKPVIVAAEEFVCLHYIAFIQNILGRIRTMTLSMVSLFVSVCLAISFYPFVPRTQISMWMIANLLLIGSVVVYVYAGMERDETLSYITNTHPGRLSGEFYLKTAGFLAGPVIGLLTAQFPSISESVLSWLQPGLDALK